MMTGGQIVAQTLQELGADTIYSVSGNQILSIYDAVIDFDLRIIHMRHESAAAYAAGASAELSDRPGVLLVTAGPGFLAATIGVATAKSMELPLLFLSGASATSDAGAGGFQDLDQGGVARVTCKATMQVSSIEVIRTTLTNAWQLAQSSIPGPVHVSLPSDVLSAVSPEMPRVQKQSPAAEFAIRDESTLKAMAERLMQAKRPLIIARQSAGRGAAGKALHKLAQQLGIRPIITESARGLSDLKNREIVSRFRDSDCVLAISPADFAVGFLAESVIARAGSILHIDAPGDPQPRRVADLRTQLPPDIALPYLAEATTGHQPRLADWAQLWSFPRTNGKPPESSPHGLHPLEVTQQVRGLLEPDDIIVLDGGEFCQWARLGLRNLPNRMFWNSKLGGIGGSIPMALGIAATGHSGRTIVFIGDGSFGYHASEFETAVRYALPMVVIVGNDARWGAEWHLQISRYGQNRAYETDLLPARYDQVAVGLGAAGFHVAESISLHDALLASLSGSQPACLNVQILSVQSPAVAP
jgi:thiamine pyrophosphate-dependent acetolactate synthase large subunit-like protein